MSRQELDTYWTLDDVLTAHEVLDAIEEAEAQATAPPPEQDTAPRPRRPRRR